MMQLVARRGELLQQLHLMVEVDEEGLVRSGGFGFSGSIVSTNLPAALRSSSIAPETLRLVSTRRPSRKGRLVSRVKLSMVCGRPSSVRVKSLILRLVTREPFLSRTVTGRITSRAWTLIVVAGWLEAGSWAGLAAGRQARVRIDAERQKKSGFLIAVNGYTPSLP